MPANKPRNHRSPEIMRKPFDAQHATQEDVKKQITAKVLTPDSMGGTIFYAATVIAVEEQAQVAEAKEKSFFSFFSTPEAAVTFKKYRIYIPEVHECMGPPPEIFPDGTDIKKLEPAQQVSYVQSLEKVKSYPLVEPFYPMDPNKSVFAINDPVWVFFQNSKNLENGMIYSKITNVGVPGNNTAQNGTTSTPPQPPAPEAAKMPPIPSNLTGEERLIYTLVPEMQERVRKFLQTARAAGYRVVVTQARRTMAEQSSLYAKGRTAPGGVVTNAPPGTSAHNYGMAIDFAFLDENNKPSWPENGPWKEAAQFGKAAGLSWGGDWKSFKDRPHLELDPQWKVAYRDWKAGKIQVA